MRLTLVSPAQRMSLAGVNELIHVATVPHRRTAASEVGAGTSDAVILVDTHVAERAAEWESVLQRRQHVALWCSTANPRVFRYVAGGSAVQGVVAGRMGVMTDVRGIRQRWLASWAARVSAIGSAASAAGVGSLAYSCFTASLRVDSVRGLCDAVREPHWRLQRSLASMGFRGPKRFLAAARVVLAWERMRLGTCSLESVAHTLGFSSLAAMDRSMKTLVDASPRRLRLLSDEQLAPRLRAALMRRDHGVEKGKVVSKNG